MTIRAIVVGGTSGIGYAIACRVAASYAPTGSTVLISGRTKPANFPPTGTSNMEFRALDATSMRQIHSYTKTLKSSVIPQPTLDLLVMSQGIMSTAPRTEVEGEAIDRKMALHYYGKQLLIRELLPLMTPTARVVIVYDGWLGSPDKLLWDDLDLSKGNYSLKKAADHCTSMMDGMVQWWAASQDGNSERSFVHAYPGGVNTNLMREVVPGFLQGVLKIVGGAVLTSPETCAERLLEGVERCVREGRGWSNIDNKGKLLGKKAIWTGEQMDEVARHTWGLVDQALEGGE
ncbi:putative oxidoreductase YkvO [Podospora australis]|uniref:Oxidoreductase YkvO n=1 Tax=Podospora australis TaxID=1536484 RepID=A0AAN6WL81_9PEZI|nr:putative oxidoreductase YkvO [Podospora australis]